MRHNNGHFFKIIPQPPVVRKPNDLEEKKYQQINKFISDSLITNFDIDYEGEITLGVRPDKINIVNDTDTNNGSAKVYSVELTGEANLVTFKSNNQNLIVKTDKNTQYDIDSVLKLNFNKEDCYFFDINSEERLRI